MSKIQNNTEKPKNLLINGKTVWRRLGRSKEITWRYRKNKNFYIQKAWVQILAIVLY